MLDQVCIFQYTYFYSFQIHHETIINHFQHTNHNILLNFLFKNLYKPFLRAHRLHQYHLPYFSYCKNLLFQVMMFHCTFRKHPYIHKDKHLFQQFSNHRFSNFENSKCILHLLLSKLENVYVLTLRARTVFKFLKKHTEFRCTGLLRSNKLVHLDSKNLTFFI